MVPPGAAPDTPYDYTQLLPGDFFAYRARDQMIGVAQVKVVHDTDSNITAVPFEIRKGEARGTWDTRVWHEVRETAESGPVSLLVPFDLILALWSSASELLHGRPWTCWWRVEHSYAL